MTSSSICYHNSLGITCICCGTGGWGSGHQGHVPPLSKDLPFSVPPSNCLGLPVTNCNVTWRNSKTLRPGILATSSPNINLGTSMTLEAISEHLITFFSGEHAPKSPRVCVSYTRQMQCIVGEREQVVWSIYVAQAVKSKPS